MAANRNSAGAPNPSANPQPSGRTNLLSLEQSLELKRPVHPNRDPEETGHPGQDPERETDETGQDQEEKSTQTSQIGSLIFIKISATKANEFDRIKNQVVYTATLMEDIFSCDYADLFNKKPETAPN